MPNSQLLKNWIALSVLFHLTVMVLASMIPLAPLRPPDVMVVDLADLPRSIDFPRPQPGIVEGAPPKPPAPAPPTPARRAKPPPPPAEGTHGALSRSAGQPRTSSREGVSRPPAEEGNRPARRERADPGRPRGGTVAEHRAPYAGALRAAFPPP